MEMEHIDKNTIRVIISHDELSDHGISLWDLLSDKKKMEKFFYRILKEIDTDHNFVGDDTVTFQVLPNQDGMLEMIISKNNNIVSEQLLNQLSSSDKKGEDKISNLDLKITNKHRNNDNSYDYLKDSVSRNMLVKFVDFDSYLLLIKDLNINGINSSLYEYHNEYYLYIEYNENLSDVDKKKLFLIYEYGEPTSFPINMLLEHGKILIENDAINKSKNYFFE